MTSFRKIKVDVDDHIAYLTLNSPDNLNAIDLQMQEELLKAFLKLSGDPAVRVIVLNGEGRAFSSGGDIQSMQDSLDKDVYAIMKNWVQRMHFLEMQIRTVQKPVIAAVHGVVSGSGFSLALSCDFVLASTDTSFSQSFVRLGLTADSTYFLPRLVGLLKATEIMFLGEEIVAQEALKLGIVNRVFPAEELAEETRLLAERLGSGPTEALGHIKSLINTSFYQSLDQHLQEESELIARTAKSQDFREGVKAFLEKREPVFKGL